MFLKWAGTAEICRARDATLAPLHFSYLGPISYCGLFGSKNFSQPIGMLNFGVSLVWDPTPRFSYIWVWFQQTWGPKNPYMDLTFGLNIRPKGEDWFLKL